MKLLTVLLLCTLAIGCGYGSHSTTPPTPAATPTITALNPPNVVAGSASFALVVDGSSFSSNAVINFAGNPEPTTTVTNGSKLTAMIPASAITTAAMVPVTVTNPAVQGGPYGGGKTAVTSAPMTFQIN